MTPVKPIINYARKVSRVKEVHDGDTFRLEIDQGCGDYRELWVRLHGIDVWELSQPLGPEARDYVKAYLGQASEILIQTFKTAGGADVTSFIRYVADVWVDNVFLADHLAGLGYAKVGT